MSRELADVNGIVLKAVRSKESDLVLSLLTAEKGRITVFARGAAKSKKGAAYAQPFAYSRFELVKGAGDMFIVSAAALTEAFYGLRNDILLLSEGQYFLEVASLIPENTDDPGQFLSLLLNSLYLLTEKKMSPKKVKLVFELTFLRLSGFLANASACSVCGALPSAWSFEDGFLCADCSDKTVRVGQYPISEAMLSAVRHISETQGAARYAFSMSEEPFSSLCALSERYIQYKYETKFKTLSYLNGLKNE